MSEEARRQGQPDHHRRGYLIPIGGAERRGTKREILRRFVSLCGGDRARLVIIPTASRDGKTGKRYELTFRDLGAGESIELPFRRRSDAERSDWLDTLESADGIFFAGGVQLRLSKYLGGTEVERIVRDRFAQGAHVAGTSAGASYMSEHMIAFGDEGSTPRTHMVALAPGLGLANGIIIDQHFRQRSRLGRLMTALAYSPSSLGLGLDEGTAVFIGPDDTLEVVGRGAATIVDGSDLEYSSVGKKKGDPVSLVGLRLHILLAGARFDLRNRTATPPPDSEDIERLDSGHGQR